MALHSDSDWEDGRCALRALKAKLFPPKKYTHPHERKRSVSIAVVTPRHLNVAHIVSHFLMETKEGREIHSQLKEAARANLSLYFADPNVCPVFYERTLNECRYVLFSSEDEETKLEAITRSRRLSSSRQSFVIASKALPETPVQGYPVIDGMGFQLRRYAGKNMLITTICPDISMAEHFLEDIVPML